MSESKKHLTLEQREFIEDALKNGMNFSQIARQLGFSPSTISREVKKHRTLVAAKDKNIVWNKISLCVFRRSCSVIHLCPSCKSTKYCKNCIQRDCSKICGSFKPLLCDKINHPPYVCNNCNRKRTCYFEKYYYRAKDAHRQYQQLKSESRQGINLSPDELARLDDLVSPLIWQGQSLSHIYAQNRYEIPCSIRTLYEYVSQKLFTATDLDLRRKVKYKKRKKSNTPCNYRYRQGRTYEDFLKLMAENPYTDVVEMDTVEGNKDSNEVLLTLYFRSSHFMLAFKLPHQNSESVIDIFNALENIFGTDGFRKIFPIILTDNGSEFKDPISLEEALFENEGIPRCMIFYCDPGKSYQKGSIEKNHEFIRYVVPKGKSFEPYSDYDIDLMMNHINSYARACQGHNFVPFDRIYQKFPELIEKLGYSKISPNEINLTPSLLKK